MKLNTKIQATSSRSINVMKLFKLLQFTFFVTIISSFENITLPVYITGHIRKNPNDTSAYIEHLNIYVKGNKRILAKTFTDNKGNFFLSFTPGTEPSFDFFCNGIGIDTLLLSSITTFESDTPDLTLYIPAEPLRNSSGKVICLKCNKADRVYPIEYGEPIYVLDIGKAGKRTISPIYHGKYQAGSCIVKSARYFCDRDNVKF